MAILMKIKCLNAICTLFLCLVIGVLSDLQAQIPTVSLTFVNAENNQDLFTLSEPRVINLEQLGTTDLSLRAETIFPQVGSVGFQLSGPLSYTGVENTAPYALFGLDALGNYLSQSLPDGNYELIVQVYTQANAQGFVITSRAASFEIRREGAPDLGDWNVVWQDDLLDENQNLFPFQLSSTDRDASYTSTDRQGNLYVGGDFVGDADGGTFAGAYATKYDVEGRIAWRYVLGFDFVASGGTLGLTADDEGNTYWIIYSFNDDSFQGVSIPSGNTLIKLDTQGNVLWAEELGLTEVFFFSEISVDVGPLETVYLYLEDSEGSKLLKYDAQGNLMQDIPFIASDIEELRVDALGRFYTVGQARVALYNPQGSLLWERVLVADSEGTLSLDQLRVDPLGGVYIAGSFQGQLDLKPGASGGEIEGPDTLNYFVAKYDEAGNLVRSLVIRPNIEPDFREKLSIDVDAQGRLYVGGNFKGTLLVSPGVTSELVSSEEGSSTYLIQFDASGNELSAFTLPDASRTEALEASSSGDLFLFLSTSVEGDIQLGA